MQRFLNPRMFGQPTDESRVKEILDDQLPVLLGYLEGVIPEHGPLVGDSLSVADLAVVTCFLQARYGEFEVDGTQHPALRSYLDRSFAHEIVVARMAKEANFVAAMAN